MLKRTWPAIVLAALLTAGVLAYTWASKLWAAVAIGMAAIFLNGLIATLEDDLAGGFNNPDGTVTPKYVRIVAWTIRGVVAMAMVATGVVMWLWKFG